MHGASAKYHSAWEVGKVARRARARPANTMEVGSRQFRVYPDWTQVGHNLSSSRRSHGLESMPLPWLFMDYLHMDHACDEPSTVANNQ